MSASEVRQSRLDLPLPNHLLHLQMVVASKEAAQRERDLYKRERDRYRKALEGIARLEHVAAADSAVNAAGRDAREALDRA